MLCGIGYEYGFLVCSGSMGDQNRLKNMQGEISHCLAT